MDTIAVITTIDSHKAAQAMAAALVERKLAACVQISPIESFYSWQGETQHEQEFRVVAKSLAVRYAEVEATMRELHSYELPGIYAIAVAEIFEPYAHWVIENSGGVVD